jgi:D-alanyl-D-alanine carboxypeptidase
VTLGRAGSVTKLFASALVSMLVERGDIRDLDVPLRDLVWRQEFSRIANSDRATLRQLLNHTSGIADYLSSPALIQAALGRPDFAYHTKEQLLEFAYDQPATFEPGAGWQYSNTNYLLVELAVEAVTGQSGPQVMRSLVIEPLALESTSYDPEQMLPDGMAHGYADFGDAVQHDVTALGLERFHFDGGVISNVHDLADFLDAVLVSSVLSESSREALLDVVPTYGSSGRGTDYYGLGLILEDSPEYGPVYGHLGTSVGFTTHVYRIMDAGVTFAAIVNGSQAGYEPTSYEWFSPLLSDKILQLLSGQWKP